MENRPIDVVFSTAVPTAIVRGRMQAEELAKFVPAACGEVWNFVRSAGLPKPGRHVALYLEDGWVEVGVEVAEPFTGNDRVLCSQLPAGQTATTAHHGPYQGLSKTHAALREWCAAHGHRATGISWELYGHWEEAWYNDPSQIRTDVFVLLEGIPEA